MANKVYDLRCVDIFPPWWLRNCIVKGHVDSHGTRPAGRYLTASTMEGFVSISDANNYWNTYPVVTDLPPRDFEVLVKVKRLSFGTQNYVNTGGGIFLGSDKSQETTSGYALSLGSGSTARLFSVYTRRANGTQVRLDSNNGSIVPTAYAGQIINLRVSVSGDTISCKMWDEQGDEPEEWQFSIKNSEHPVFYVSILTHGYGLQQIYEKIAVSTGGETAHFNNENETSSAFDVPVSDGAYLYSVQDAESKAVLEVGSVDDQNPIIECKKNSNHTKLQANIYTLHQNDATPINLFALDGHAFLAGEFPTGITTIDGVPGSADIKVVVRSDSQNIDGVTVSKIKSNHDGTWRVDGLNPQLQYDVIGRKDGFNDVIVSNIKPVNKPGLVSDLVEVVIGVPFRHEIITSGGEGEVAVEMASGSLPEGLQFDSGEILGEWPTGAEGDYLITLDLTDSEETVQVELTVRLVLEQLVAAVTMPGEIGYGLEQEPIQIAVQGGEKPYTFSVLNDSLPDGFSIGEDGLITATPAEYGVHEITIKVEDVRGGEYILTAETEVIRKPYAELVASLTPPDRGIDSSSDMTLSIPETVEAGDLMLISVMRRQPVSSITDDSELDWVVVGESQRVSPANGNIQYETVYSRRAVENESGRVVTIKSPTAGRLIPYLSAFRGSSGKTLEIVGVLDNTSSPHPAIKEPYELLSVQQHRQMIIRSASWWFANFGSFETKAEVSDMLHVGPVSSIASSAMGQLRNQVAYMHYARPGVASASLTTNAYNNDNIVCEVVIILDEQDL